MYKLNELNDLTIKKELISTMQEKFFNIKEDDLYFTRDEQGFLILIIKGFVKNKGIETPFKLEAFLLNKYENARSFINLCPVMQEKEYNRVKDGLNDVQNVLLLNDYI